MTAKTMMMRALDIYMIEDEEKEIGQVLTIMYDCMDGQSKTMSFQI